MIPTIGRIVHYTDIGNDQKKQFAAIITDVKLHNQFYQGQPPPDSEENKYQVTLHIFYDRGARDTEASFSAEYKDLHWTWPPKV